MSSRRRSLPTRTHLLTLITALYAHGHRAKAFDFIRTSLQSAAIPKRFFSELFTHLSLFLGYPAMLDGLERLHVLTPQGHSTRINPRRLPTLRSRGMGTLRKVYGNQSAKLLQHLEALQPGLGKRIAEDAYGTVMARRGLSLAEREIVNVVALFIGGYRRQLYSHLRGALRSGVRPAVLKSVLRSAGKIAQKDVQREISVVDEIIRNRSKGSL